LKWNPIDYNNITTILLDSETIWTPDIQSTLFTEVENEEIVQKGVKILVNSSGYVKYSVPNRFSVPTKYNLTD
jgi:hypothetical protein